MTSVLIDAALRSLFVGLIVVVGMRAFRIRNVFTRKTATSLVLVGALSMPLLMQMTHRIGILPAKASIVFPAHSMTLLQELQARLQARSGSGAILKPVADPLPAPNPSHPEGASANPPDTAPALETQESVFGTAARVENMQPLSQPDRTSYSPVSVALVFYLGVAAVLLLRLLIGLAVTLRLWFDSAQIPTRNLSEIPTGLCLRASARVSSPLTIGSAILLPADYETWDQEKFRIVLAHERSHIRQCDFYLQALAGLYAALVWFSPLGWWIKRELADLAEAISDRAGIEQARSRASYAQILLEFAAAPRPAALGVAMARPGSLSRRIERVLNERTFRQSFAEGRRALFVFVLIPIVLFAATAMVRVQAAAAQSARIAWIAPAVSTVPSLQVSQHETADPIDRIAAEDTGEEPAMESVPDASAGDQVSPEAETATINTPEVAAAQTPPNLFPVPAVPRAVAGQSESGNSQSFDRILPVSGGAQLMVSTSSGNIHLSHGSGNQIKIHGQIHVSRNGSEEQARQIAANPPIEQDGNLIRVGQQHDEHWRGISIDYQIETPAGAGLTASSGSGDIVDEGVGQNARLETGSGDIRVYGLHGSFEVKTGSGNIIAEQTGQGDVKAETGSGNIEIKEIHGSFHAKTGSGDIKGSGTPSAPWTLETGSGNIEIWTGNAPLTLDASTGSGSVATDHEMLVKGSLDRHRVNGNLNGGGPLVRVETGSGDIHIH